MFEEPEDVFWPVLLVSECKPFGSLKNRKSGETLLWQSLAVLSETLL